MNRPTIIGEPFTVEGMVFVTYLCEKAGDGLDLHGHGYNHLCQPLVGEIECFTESGKTLRRVLGDKPAEFGAGVRHGIKAITDGAIFQNISPIEGWRTETGGAV